MRRDADLHHLIMQRIRDHKLRDVVAAYEPVTEPQKRVREAWNWPRASEIGYCVRAQALKGNLPAGASRMASAEEVNNLDFGSHVHSALQAALPEFETETEWRSAYLVGHSDLWLRPEIAATVALTPRVADIKTTSSKSAYFLRQTGPKAEHVLQANWYAVQAKTPMVSLVYLVKGDDYSLPLDEESVLCFSAPTDMGLARAADDRAFEIWQHVRQGTLPEYSGEIWECAYCTVSTACEATRLAERPKEVIPW